MPKRPSKSVGRDAANRLTVLVDEVPTQDDVFKVTPARFAAAAARHPDVARLADARFSHTPAEFAAAIGDVDALIGWRFSTDEVSARARRLKWIQLTGAGVEHMLPLDWLPAEALLTNSSGAHAPKVREFVTMALLMLNSGVPLFATNQRQARWEQRFTRCIAGKTVVIVGVGEMGSAAAASAKRLGLTVIGVRRSGRPRRPVDRMVTPDSLNEVLPAADFLIVAAPLTRATRGLIGRSQLDRMKPEAGILNIGRAAVIDYEALGEKLARGALAGAVLDVFAPEPLPPDSPLWHVPNLMVIPHVSSDEPEAYIERLLDVFFDNVRRWRDGRPLRNRIDPIAEY
jgi:phosphoglycerate dehydrogenase-like enzyme